MTARPHEAASLLALAALAAAPLAQKGLRTYRTKESILKSNAPAEVSKAVSRRIENYCDVYREFYDDLGLKRKNDNKISVRLFDTHDEFRSRFERLHPGKRVPAAYFSPAMNALVLYNDEGNVTLRATLLHECSHQFLNRYTYDAPKWINEGLAEYFEGWRTTPAGKLVERRPLLFDLLLVQGALGPGGRPLDPRTLVEMDAATFDAFPGANTALHPYLHYATAWALVWYSLEGDHEGDRERMVDYLRSLQEDGPNARFEVDDWDAFERRWREFIGRMSPELEGAEDHFLVAGGYFQNGDYAAARKHYRTAAELEPDYPGVELELGLCAYRMLDLAAARRHFAAATAARPEDANCVKWLARATRPTDPAGALELALDAAELESNSNPWTLNLVAACQEDSGDPRGAVRTLKKALKLCDEDDDVAYFEGRIEDVRRAGK